MTPQEVKRSVDRIHEVVAAQPKSEQRRVRFLPRLGWLVLENIRSYAGNRRGLPSAWRLTHSAKAATSP